MITAAEINNLAPEAYLTPDMFKTEHDQKVDGFAKDQQLTGMKIGQESHTILVTRDGAWSAFKHKGGMVSSNEIIGVHANTSDLLRGFLASSASIVIQKMQNGEIAYTWIKQCSHRPTMEHICPLTVFDLNQMVPIWRETTEEQHQNYLGAVPPKRYGASAYLSGEPYTHNDEGRGVYLACKKQGDRYFAKMMTVAEFNRGVQ